MKTPAFLAVAFLVVAGCGQPGDTSAGVTAPESIASPRSDLGLKPPPPLGSEETSIFIGVDADSFLGERVGGPSAAFASGYPGFSGIVRGRYFANTPDRNAWIQFESFGDIIASSDARLQYNETTGKTHGKGTLTDANGVVLDLSLVQIDAGSVFGTCGSGPFGSCAHFSFVYNGTNNGGGSVSPVGL